MSYVVSLLASIVWLPLLAATDLTPVDLPPGKTPLREIGIYRVSYQSYGGEQVDMPMGWVGHFDTNTGISYLPDEFVQGRRSLLLHSPWRVPPGKTWVEYRLRLPEVRPISLGFGIAMRADAMEPDRSDGSTFSCMVIDENGERELMREHCAQTSWKDFHFDLSEDAGHIIALRLQMEPGPANSPSWDYSYFGDPAIVVGSDTAQQVSVADLLHSRPFAATTGVSLVNASNKPAAGVTPSNLLEHTNSILRDGNAYRFVYQGADCDLTYTYAPQTGTLDDFTAQVDDGPPFLPAYGGGVTALDPTPGTVITPLHGGRATKAELTPDRNALDVTWAYPIEDREVEVHWQFAIRGKALTVVVDCEEPILNGFSLGREGNVPLRERFAIPYLFGHVSYLEAQQAFVSRYLDWTVSHGSQAPQADVTYEPKTDGTRNPLHESGYVAVSPNVTEVLPNIPHPPSPYLDLIGPRIMLDIWQHHDGTYQGDGENLRELKDNGVDHLAIISHVWQRYGYDVKLPDHIPANPRFGGDDGMKAFGRAANDCGYVWSLHENYIDLYPDAPSFDPTARVLNADGTPSLGWYNAGTRVQAFGIKCNRSLGFAEQNSPEIHARFETNAAYLDVHTCVPPWQQLDHDATQPMAAMALDRVQRDTALFQYERDTHGGPLFGEGNWHFYWAGRCDGVEAQVSGGEDHVPFLDFDLLKIHPQMVNHGMGYYERWFRRGYEHQWGFDTGSVEQIDKYRAQEIAYGHAGFIGAAQADNVQWIAKEHHLMHPIQRLTTTAKVTDIAYEVDGRMAPSSVALLAGQRARQRITYDSNMSAWVNWAEEPWKIEGRTLPQWGFLALGPDTTVETALHDRYLGDYAECPEFLFCDARTSFHMPYLRNTKNIEPRLKNFAWLGANRVQLTYEWIVNETLDRDYTCFVHFTNPLISTADSIAFQQDHPLPKPTSEWKPGETVVDGPYEVTIPDEPLTEYAITLGLIADARLRLQGVGVPGNRIIIGKLLVQRDSDNKVLDVSLGNITTEAAKSSAKMADFSAHLNPSATWIDFGTVATDGSFKVNRGDRELVVFPYPRDKAFTVAIDVARVCGTPPSTTDDVHIEALAARTLEPLGDVPYETKDGRIVFDVGTPGAGRYRIGW